MQNSPLRQEIIIECHERLISAKAELLNQVRENRNQLQERERGGDEADLSVANLSENQTWAVEKRLRQKLFEIEAALGRIQKGIFGICEETEEPIEEQRLLTIPWTRLSIEGAEIREALSHRQIAR